MPLGREGKLWMGAARKHRLAREACSAAGDARCSTIGGVAPGRRGTSLAGPLYVVSLDPRIRPDPSRLKRILKAGGGRVWSEEALPPNQGGGGGGGGGVIALVPAEASAADCALLGEARAAGVPCVSPEFVIEQLTRKTPRGLEAFAVGAV